MRTLRLRQAVVAASDRDGVVEHWTAELNTGAPFHDPGVEEFGLGADYAFLGGDVRIESQTLTEVHAAATETYNEVASEASAAYDVAAEGASQAWDSVTSLFGSDS